MSATLSRLEKQLANLDPDSTRYQVIVAVRNFRSNWVELGKLLTDVAYGGDYKEWGYDDFEIYCARELGLKKPTVKKLMVSYSYMKSYAPERLQRRPVHEHPDNGGALDGYDVPDYQTVELLQQVRNNQHLDDEVKDDFHRRAFAPWATETSPLDGVTLRKEIREHTRAYNDDAIAAAHQRRGSDLGALKTLARKMRERLVSARTVPEGLKTRLEAALCELEELD